MCSCINVSQNITSNYPESDEENIDDRPPAATRHMITRRAKETSYMYKVTR